MQYYILAFIKHNNKKSSPRTKFVHSIHSIVIIVQFLLTGIIALVILQILIAHEYSTIMLYIALSLSYGLWIVSLGLLAKALFSWYTSRKNFMVLYLHYLWLLMSLMESLVCIVKLMGWQKEALL